MEESENGNNRRREMQSSIHPLNPSSSSFYDLNLQTFFKFGHNHCYARLFRNLYRNVHTITNLTNGH